MLREKVTQNIAAGTIEPTVMRYDAGERITEWSCRTTPS